MQSPLEELDPSFVESSVQSSVKSLYKVAKIFTQRGFEGGAECAKKLQTSFEAFQEYLPLVQVSTAIPILCDFTIITMSLTRWKRTGPSFARHARKALGHAKS